MTITPASAGVSEATSGHPAGLVAGSSIPFGTDGFTSLSTSFPQISALRRAEHRLMNYFTLHRQLHSVDASASGASRAAAVRAEAADVVTAARSIVVPVGAGQCQMKSANDGG